MITVLCNESPWPTRSGGRVRMAGLIGALRREHEVCVLVARRWSTDLVEGNVVALPASGRSRAAALAGQGPFLGRGLLGPAATAVVAEHARKAQAVLVTHSYLAAELPTLAAPVVIDLQNLEVERQLSTGGALGRLEYLKARRWEPRVVRGARAVLCVDDEDARAVRGWGASEVLVVPNVVDAPVSPPSPAGGSLLAVADWKYLPNSEGLQWFLREVAPSVDGTLVLAGRGSEAYGGRGFVEDLASLYDESALVLSPVQGGAGTQLKVLEALARGRVVVTTRYGSRSIPGGVQAACVIEDDPVAMAREIHRLLNDPAERHEREELIRAAAVSSGWVGATAPLMQLLAGVEGG